jgi:pimeloyl-ACP methyl ester carboxylesterase
MNAAPRKNESNEPAQAPAPTDRMLVVNGISMYVEVAGSGPEVLLLHGFPDSHLLWRNQVPALVAAGFRVVVPDLRGYGETQIPAGGEASYRIETLVADVVTLLDTLGIDKVQLVAHDWGAVIGWAFVIAHPERVERYVAISVGHPTAYARAGLRQRLRAWYILVIQLRGFAEWLFSRDGFAPLGFFSGFPQELPNWRANLSRPGRFTAALSYYRANLRLILPFDHGDVKVPVMGVWSSRDVALVERQMTDSARFCMAGFRYERLDGVGHWIPLQAPDRLNPLLLDYLRR